MTESRIVAWLRWKLEVYVRSGFGSSAEDLVSEKLGTGIYAYEDASVAMVVFEHGLTYRAADRSFDCLYTEIERALEAARGLRPRERSRSWCNRDRIARRGPRNLCSAPLRLCVRFSASVEDRGLRCRGSPSRRRRAT